MPVQIGGGGDSVSFSDPASQTASVSPDGSVYAPMDSQVTFDNTGVQGMPTTQTYNGWGPVSGGGYNNASMATPQSMSQLPASGGGGGAMNTAYQPGNTIGGGAGGGASMAPPPPVHHDAAWYRNNGAQEDGTYVAQKAALMSKLDQYERQVAGQIGDKNVAQGNNPNLSLIGNDYWKVNPLGTLFSDNKDANGNDVYTSNKAIGGTIGAGYDTAVANFENQQSKGLTDLAEGYAARGMLGPGSGVWSNARANLQDQYNNQFGNINQQATGAYNNLLNSLADQYTQGQQTLNGYLGDASNRLATADAAGLPVQ